jgi:hypothetical protein
MLKRTARFLLMETEFPIGCRNNKVQVPLFTNSEKSSYLSNSSF